MLNAHGWVLKRRLVEVLVAGHLRLHQGGTGLLWHCHGAHGLKERGNGIAMESGRDNGHGHGYLSTT